MKSELKFTLVALLAILLSGCAAVSRPLSSLTAENCWKEQEQSIERTRFFPKIGENEALQASEQIFRLAGKEGMKIETSPHSVSAEYYNRSMIYLFLVAHSVEVWDRWLVSTRATEEGVWVCVHVAGQYFSDAFVLGAEPRTNAIYPASAIEPEPRRRLKPPSYAYPVNYDTFWGRLEYLLGQSKSWPGCKWGGGFGKNKTSGQSEMDPLCHVLDDEPPAAGLGH